MFSVAMFRDGTVEVSWREKENLKVYKLRPRNPAIMLLPLFSTLGLAMGSDILLREEVKRVKG